MAAAGNTPVAERDAAGTVVSLRHVTLRYGDKVTALDDVSLDVAAGERVCVLGANGSGKSTLTSVVCGLLAPDEGEVELLGERVLGPEGVDFEAYRRARREIGLVFQNPDDQIVTSIVEEDVAFGPENLGVPADQIGARVERELARVAMGDYAKADPSRLSGGQKQRVAIAGALAMEPRVLVLDEPGALLDVRGRRGIMRVMAKLRDEGTTVVHITHFMEEALAADRVLVMDRGRVVLDGTPDEVFSHGEQLSALGLEEPFAARLASRLRERGVDVPWTCDEDALLSALRETKGTFPFGSEPKGTDVRPEYPNSETSQRETSPLSHPAVSCEDVTFSYHEASGRLALDGVSLAVEPGSYTTLIGQTGSGKSTLIRLICALEVPDAGRVVVDGIDTANRRDRRRLHGHVGYVMQHPERQLFAETVLQDVGYGPRNMGLSPDEVASRCERALALVGLAGREDASPFQLSGGQQRLCAIAGILAMDPQILVLDEPTAGLDPRGRAHLEQILADINASGVTIVRVTHNMDLAAHADNVAVLSQSHLLMQGTAAEVFSPANETTLHDAGLGLPEPLRWAMRLGLSATPLTIDALVDAICAATAGEGAVR